MARKVEVHIITAPPPNRDHGKRFRIREMAALRAEKWAARALLALAKSGAQLPENLGQAGMAGLAVAGLRALQNLDWADAEPLLDEMMSCVSIMPDERHPELDRPLVIGSQYEGDDVEELSTYIELRQKVFEIHTSFFSKGK